MSHKFFRRDSKSDKTNNESSNNNNNNNKRDFSDRKAQLTPLEYRVTQERQTERPFSNKYNRHWEPGSYHCIVCDAELFESDTKFESKSGWPAFSNVVDPKRVKLAPDLSHIGANLLLLIAKPDLARTEVSCANCNAHLGHLFKDGPKPTGLRYCINSSSLHFIPTNPSSTFNREISTEDKVDSSRSQIQPGQPQEFACKPENTCSKTYSSTTPDRPSLPGDPAFANSAIAKKSQTLPPMATLCLSGEACQRKPSTPLSKPFHRTELSQSTEAISTATPPKVASNDNPTAAKKSDFLNFTTSATSTTAPLAPLTTVKTESTAIVEPTTSPFQRTMSAKYPSSKGASLIAARKAFFQGLASGSTTPSNDISDRWGPPSVGSIRPFTNRFVGSLSSGSLGLRGPRLSLKNDEDNSISNKSPTGISKRSSSEATGIQQISLPPVPLKETSL